MEEAPESGSQATLRDYLVVLERRKWTLLLTIVVVVGIAVARAATATPVYKSSATLLLQSRSSDAIFGGSAPFISTRALQTEIQVIHSQAVDRLVKDRVGPTRVPRARASAVGETDVIAITATSPDPKLAARSANAYAAAYIEFRRGQAVDELEEASKQIASKVRDLDAQLAATKDLSARETLIRQQAVFKEQIDKLDVSSRLRQGGAQLVTPAGVPLTPFSPTPRRDAVLALIMGAALGAGLAFLREYLDDTVKDHDELERSLRGAPTLGLIPSVGSWRDEKSTVVVSLTDPGSVEAEAYRALRTSITFAGLERSVKTILFTSGNPSEGKSTTVANLGVALARAGKRVVIIDADLRRPRVNSFFGLPSDVGLTSVLVGDARLDAAVHRVPGARGLWLLPSGPLLPNPSELLAGTRAAQLIAALADSHDFVLVDSPPMLPVSDAIALSARVDAIVLVALARKSTKRELKRCAALLAQVGAPLIGSILNRVRGGGGYGQYGYGHYGGSAYAAAIAAAASKEPTGPAARTTVSTAPDPGVSPERVDVGRGSSATPADPQLRL